MDKFECMYTELLETLLGAAEDAEKNATTKKDKADWGKLNRSCRKELYKTKGRITKRGKDEDGR